MMTVFSTLLVPQEHSVRLTMMVHYPTQLWGQLTLIYPTKTTIYVSGIKDKMPSGSKKWNCTTSAETL